MRPIFLYEQRSGADHSRMTFLEGCILRGVFEPGLEWRRRRGACPSGHILRAPSFPAASFPSARFPAAMIPSGPDRRARPMGMQSANAVEPLPATCSRLVDLSSRMSRTCAWGPFAFEPPMASARALHGESAGSRMPPGVHARRNAPSHGQGLSGPPRRLRLIAQNAPGRTALDQNEKEKAYVIQTV